ncbi:MAG: hypothetical protein M3P83_05650 [Actinomycetota bacterium]|nr:hypothetical protein [Actinomycetota bacterium]
MVQVVAPPGWPAPVPPAGVPGWEEAAVRWLLDVCPPEFRSYGVLRRHAVVLARFAAAHVDAGLAASRTGLGEARTSLRDHVAPETVEAAVAAWEREIARLIALRRSVGLVEDAVRGRRFRPRL